LLNFIRSSRLGGLQDQHKPPQVISTMVPSTALGAESPSGEYN